MIRSNPLSEPNHSRRQLCQAALVAAAAAAAVAAAATKQTNGRTEQQVDDPEREKKLGATWIYLGGDALVSALSG